MKILHKDLKHGRIKVIPEVLDDLWTLYNVIMRNDVVYAKTSREVKRGERYDQPEKGRRIPVFLGLKVKDVYWDRTLNRLRVHGIVTDAPEEIGAKGSHHTINVTLNRPLTILKERWLKHHLESLEKATGRGISPIIMVSVDDERCCIAVLKHFRVEVKMERAAMIPGKRNPSERERAVNEYFKMILSSLREVSSSANYPIVILGVGFTKDSFFKFLKDKAPDLAGRVSDVKGVNNSGLAGIMEALRSGVLRKTVNRLRISEEVKAVEEVLRRLGKGEGNVAYGFDEAEEACLFGSIDTLLVTDVSLREAEDDERRKIEDLMRSVEEKGGRVIVVSTEHEAGLKLLSLGGVAALLRFSLKQKTKT